MRQHKSHLELGVYIHRPCLNPFSTNVFEGFFAAVICQLIQLQMAQIAHQMKDKDWVYILDRLMDEIDFVIVEKSSAQNRGWTKASTRWYWKG